MGRERRRRVSQAAADAGGDGLTVDGELQATLRCE